jgi:hypothetical protein
MLFQNLLGYSAIEATINVQVKTILKNALITSYA